MPAFGNIALNDATTPTPVTRTFNPVRIASSGIASHANRVTGIPVGYDQLDLQLVDPKGANGVHKAVVHVNLPTLAQTSPSTGSGIQPNPTQAYSHRVKVEFWMPAAGTLQERKNILELAKNALANANIKAMVENLEAVY